MKKLKDIVLENEKEYIEDFYFKNMVEVNIPNEYTDKEKALAKRLYKRIVYHMYDSSVSYEDKKNILDEYNWGNLNKAIIDTVKAVKDNNCLDKNIVCADITRIPFDNLFYDLEVEAKDDMGNKIIKTLNSVITFSSVDKSLFELGYQKGILTQNGDIEIIEHILPKADINGCYITLNFIGEQNCNGEKIKETVAIYYYLGNKKMM